MSQDILKNEKSRALLRFALSTAQMGGAVFSAVTGLNRVSLTAVAVTCLLTGISILLFGFRSKGHQLK
jgi:hypothetical protein